MRLPRPQFLKLVGRHKIDPEVFGLKVTSYDGAPHLEVVDKERLRQTLHAIQESVEPGDKVGAALHGSLERLRDSFVG